MLHLCITFDYELFLGENFLPSEEILFAPSEKLARMLEVNDVRATFFADVCSVTQHKQYGLTSYTTGFSKQIQDLYVRGHDVQLHTHPNWLNSTHSDGKWNIATQGYKIHDFGWDRSSGLAPEILRSSKAYLEQTLQVVNPAYRCMAFRAGGFCIQPESELLSVLLELGIVIDSSVAIQQRAVGTIQDYDFTRLPHKLNWRVSPEGGVGKEAAPEAPALLEVPIGAARNSIRKYLGIPAGGLHVCGRAEAGTGIRLESRQPNRLQCAVQTLYRRFMSNGILSLDTRGWQVLLRDLDEIYRNYGCDEEDQFVCLICHPKLASEDVIDNMKRFIEAIRSKQDQYDFVVMSQIAKEFKHETNWNSDIP